MNGPPQAFFFFLSQNFENISDENRLPPFLGPPSLLRYPSFVGENVLPLYWCFGESAPPPLDKGGGCTLCLLYQNHYESCIVVS